MACIYRDRLIWVYCFRQRRLRCTQGNSSCKTSYEYMALAYFFNVIVYLWRSIISSRFIFDLMSVCFCVSKGSKALSVKD